MSRVLGSFRFRAYFVCAIFFVCGGLLAGRLFFIQVVEHDFYSAKADGQYLSFSSETAIAARGNIYFKEKNGNLISAATLKEGFLAIVKPLLVTDAESVCGEAGKIVDVDMEKCVERAKKENDPYEEIAHRVDFQQAEKIRELNIEGLAVVPEKWRLYPGGSLASQTMGFVGYEKDELIGRYGLEQFYEDILRGDKESLEKGNSFAALFWELGKEFLGSGKPGGHDIVLTIEPNVQSALEGVLKELVEKWSAQNAGGIIMDPKTGAIIAMAGKPDFDPNDYGKVEDLSYFKNSLTSGVFELGSVFKPLTMAAALDVKKITPETTYFDNGYVVLDGRKIENYDGKGRGLVNMQAVLNKSLNTGAVFVMQQIGKKDFFEYFKNYGLGEKTGIDLPDEAIGNLSNLSFMRDIEYATASFGQGVAVSPIEFSVAVSSLANGGVIVKPYVVDRIIVEGGQDNITAPSIKKRVIQQDTSETMTRMLVEVVDDALLDGSVKMERYSIAAKTGTAQLVKEQGGGYYDDQYLHSFFGYAPAFDAKFLIFLYLKRPQGERYASRTLTEPFIGLMKFLLSYYEIPPDR